MILIINILLVTHALDSRLDKFKFALLGQFNNTYTGGEDTFERDLFREHIDRLASRREIVAYCKLY